MTLRSSKARRLVSAYDRAGVPDLTLMGAQLELWTVEETRYDEDPRLELSTSRTDVVLRRLDRLAQTVQRSGSD
jgi:hypothetical protein